MSEWASSEWAEIRSEVWYCANAPGFSDYVSGYRTLSADTAKDRRMEATGRTLYSLCDAYRTLLLRHYRESEKVSRHARRLALQAFCNAYDQTVDNLLTSCS